MKNPNLHIDTHRKNTFRRTNISIMKILSCAKQIAKVTEFTGNFLTKFMCSTNRHILLLAQVQ